MKRIYVLLLVTVFSVFSLLGCDLETKDASNSIKVVDTSTNEMYSSVRAPMIGNAPPLIASSTDNEYNYYLIDGGYVKNTPISSGLTIGYNGQTPITVRFEKSVVTTQSVEESLSKAVSESISNTWTGSASVSLSYESSSLAKLFGGSITGEIEYSRQWGSVSEKSNSTTNTYTVASETAESLTQSIEYTVGENNEPAGDYRLSMVTTCDVYYLLKTNRNNTELIEVESVLCARSDVRFVLQYSENGYFENSSDDAKLNFPENFYQNYEIPTKHLSSKVTLNVDGGYALDYDTISLTFGSFYDLPVPVRYNYLFAGWYSAQNGMGEKYTDYTGKLCEKWSDHTDRTLYACWVPVTNQITSIYQMQLHSQKTHSAKSTVFDLGLDVTKLKEAGCSNVTISISGTCSGYDYKMNERGRYFVLLDAVTGNEIAVWTFQVKGFGGVEGKSIALDQLNANGQYQLQLVSDQSDAYDEKLVISNIVITVTATK